MTTVNLNTGQAPDPELSPAMVRLDVYDQWRKNEGAPLVGGIYIRQMRDVEVGPWARKGDASKVKGSLIYLDGDDDMDEHLVELQPGGQTDPERHLYTEAVYVVSGRGSTTVTTGDGNQQTFEWGPGSYFVLPTNATCQFFNGSLSQPARYFSVTDLPDIMRRWGSSDFVFNNPYNFKERFAGDVDYFTADAKLYKGRVWETNFIPDIKRLPLFEWKSRGGGGTNAFMVMGAGMMENHVSSFPPGYYKKGHSHGPGAHLYITEGTGFVLTQRGNEPRIRCEWEEGSLYLSGAGDGLWLHQHFNVGTTIATYLVINQGMSRKFAQNRWQATESTVLRGGEVSASEGGRQVEYEDEDPEIHAIFEAELKKRGLTCYMKNMSPNCTGEAGVKAERAHFAPDGHGDVTLPRATTHT